MSAIKRELYSHLKFFQVLAPQDVVAGGATNGATVDLQGYDGCVFVINCGQMTSAGNLGAAEYWQLKLEHGLASAAGVSAWSECYPSQMIHSVVGMAGAYSTLNSGIFQSITSYADLSAATGKVFFVGYKGPRRYVRVALSDVGGASTISVGIIAVLGIPSDWPVQEPVGD